MARDDEGRILALERHAVQLGYDVAAKSMGAGQQELSDKFRWIALRE